MIETPKARILHTAITQVCPAVGAMNAKQTRFALIVTEQNQIFPQQSYGQGGSPLRELFRKCGRYPVPPHELSARRPRAHLRQQLVFFLCHDDTHEAIPKSGQTPSCGGLCGCLCGGHCRSNPISSKCVLILTPYGWVFVLVLDHGAPFFHTHIPPVVFTVAS